MAINIVTPSFIEAEKNFFITEALTGLDTVNNKLLYVTENVKGDAYTFPVMSANPLAQPRQLIPLDGGTTNLTDRTLNLGAFEFYEVFDPARFEQHWHRDQLTTKMLDRGLPSTFEAYMASYYVKKCLTKVEAMIHTGSVGYTTSVGTLGTPGVNFSNRYFDGFIRQALVGGSLQVASPSAITSGNIIAKLDSAKNLVPKALLASSERYKKLKIVMSVDDAQLYEEALSATSFKNQNTTERGLNQFKGYEIKICSGLPKDTFYFSWATTDLESNMHLVTNSLSDMDFVIDKLQNNSEAAFFKMKMKMGVGQAKFNEFVIHTPLVLTDFIV